MGLNKLFGKQTAVSQGSRAVPRMPVASHPYIVLPPQVHFHELALHLCSFTCCSALFCNCLQSQKLIHKQSMDLTFGRIKKDNRTLVYHGYLSDT